MYKKSLVWKIYKLIFLDIWHHQFFNSTIKPQDEDFSDDQLLQKYLTELNLEVGGVDIITNKEIFFDNNKQAILFYANHPSSLDSLFVFTFLKKIDPVFISFAHNSLHFKFLEKRIIPVAAYFKAEKLNLLGLKMKLARRLEDFNEHQAKKNNQQVVVKAVEKLELGKAVVIFPSGGGGDWQDGIGFIVDQFAKQYPTKELVLQPLKLNPAGELSSVFHGLLHSLGIKIHSTIKVKVLPRILLSEFAKSDLFEIAEPKQRAKEIKKFLKANYFQF